MQKKNQLYLNIINISIDRIKPNFVRKDINKQKADKETELINISKEERLSYYLKGEKDCDGPFKCPNWNKNEKYNKIKEICEYLNCIIFYLNNSKKENIKINFKKNLILSNNDNELIGIIFQNNNDESKKNLYLIMEILLIK